MERCRVCGSSKWCGRPCANAPKRPADVVGIPVEGSPAGGGDETVIVSGCRVCPTCHRPLPMTAAERQRRYRERKK